MNVKKVKIIYPVNPVRFTDAVLLNRKRSKADLLKNMSSLEPPQNMKDALKAAQRIVDAINNNEEIALYTDYDADGFGCAIVFNELMKQIPYNKFIIYHNTRTLGFGMKVDGIKTIMNKQPGTKLIVTSDNGIVAFDAVDYANSLGVEVIVTDHHIPVEDGTLPNAYAVVNPHRLDEDCNFRELCGTGVLYKIMALVYYLMNLPTAPLNEIVDIVALATIADVVPIEGDNYILAKAGLSKMSQGLRPQWRAFQKIGSAYEPMLSFKSKDVGFFVGPCINASSRMNGDLTMPMHAFMDVTDEQEVFDAVKELTNINEVRKTVLNARMQEAYSYVENVEDFILIDMPTCEEGVVGLVAGRICNEYYRPTIVLSKDHNGNWKGSGRSINGIHIQKMLEEVDKTHPGILLAYGGHSQACGLTVADGKVDELRKILIEYCNTNFDKDVFVEKIVVDYVMKDPLELPRLYAEQNAMEPFGCGFESPIVMITFKPDDIIANKHLRFKYKGIEVISWNSGDILAGKDVKTIEEVTAVCTITNGKTLLADKYLLQFKFN